MAWASPAWAVEWAPILKLDALGGQFFFQGDNTSFSGNANLVFSPAAKLSDKDSLVPTVASQYRRTREVRELLGGGFLTQESLDTTVGVKWIHQLDDAWALKPGLSYKNELITESKNETLGNGLFDYHKVSLGLEAERRTERLNLRQGVSAYGVRFYHYRALASSQQGITGEEIKSGDRVLDFNAYDYSVAAEWMLVEGTVLSGSILSSYRPFRDQKIVTVSGTYLVKNRTDLYGAAMAGVQQQLPRWRLGPWSVENAVGSSLGYALLVSNQHSYDAARTRFNRDYYDYYDLTFSPFYAAKAGKKLGVSVSYDYTKRQYNSRPVQLVDGSYDGTRRIFQETHTLSLSAAYALVPHLSLRVQGSFRASVSNMQYESAYRYNYETAHYFVGLSYAL